ncbi:hypothetical protein, partial [Candidatus Albibeggiatoa sp. nov. NOAA]|uniref:hypothetical protein n=1 Tax=Candidatus Albibeggiatoa sp. nov. NOAA TaxID=3162724 RepID=UPI0033006F03|nr:hypothetical protein [Thiotrichaceae bacterium]
HIPDQSSEASPQESFHGTYATWIPANLSMASIYIHQYIVPTLLIKIHICSIRLKLRSTTKESNCSR